MRQLQVTVPRKFSGDTKEILESYCSDITSSKAEQKDQKAVEFTASADSDDVDEITEKLKSIEDLESGDLSVRVLKQESLIRKGQKTRGSDSILSQAEIYSKAQEVAEFDRAEWGLIGLSSVIATYGLVTDNVIAVIGAMILAPMLSPFVASAISLSIGDRSLMVESLKSGALSVLIALFLSFISVLPVPIEVNGLVALVSEPSLTGIVLSVSVGAAAALTFVTGLRDQIAGVAVAIALVPPLASVGIGLKLQDFSLALNSATVVMINLLAIIFSGFACFKMIGLKPSTYYREKQAEKMRFVVPLALIIFGLLAVSVGISSHQSYQEYLEEREVENLAEEKFGNRIVKMEFSDEVTTLYIVGEVDEESFRREIPDGTEVEIVQLSSTG